MNKIASYLEQALELARQRRGFCAPNPAVGALVVKQQQIIGRGNHWQAGKPHAEVMALAELAEEQAYQADVYISLEPCCHFGKTPPCTELLIKRRVRAVYYGFADPNPLVAGKGQAQLRAAGIICEQISLPAIDAFYQSYAYWTKTRRPWVTAKIALSLDGKIAGPQGKPLAITGPELQRYTHQQRRQADAILSTAKTIACDDPQLNSRIEAEVVGKPVYVLDSKLSLSLNAKIWQTATKLTLFYGEQADLRRKQTLEKSGAICIQITQKCGKLSLEEILVYLGQEGIHDLWVEAGGQCFQAFINQSLVQRALIYMAPKCLGEKAYSAFSEELMFAPRKKVNWWGMGEDGVCEINF